MRMDLFFYTNVCHVCKEILPLKQLKRCSSCKLIYYCGVEHQRLDWPKHKQLCNATCKIYQNKLTLPFSKSYHNLSRQEWVGRQSNLMLLVAIEMGRKLLPFEEEMFRFPKVCMICFERDKELLEDCSDCLNVSFCKGHKKDCVHHPCDALKLNFLSSLALLLHEPKVPELKEPDGSSKKLKYFPENMADYIKFYAKINNNDESVSENVKQSLCSEFLTRPLSFIYSLQKIQVSEECKNIIIHIVGANLIELYGQECWNLIFHWLPFLASVEIYMIGPDLHSISNWDLSCENSLNDKKRINFFYLNVLYENFRENRLFKSPNYIVGYNLGLHENVNSENNSWKRSLQLAAGQNCPFFLTAYNYKEAEEEKARIKAILSTNIDPVYCEKNPFCSLRPHRDFETGGVYYQNQYLLIYASLQSKGEERQ